MIYVDETIIPTKGKYRNQKTPFRMISNVLIKLTKTEKTYIDIFI